MPERTLFWRKGKEWAVRHGPWKLVTGENGELMLFNLDDDIAEQRNLAKDRPDVVDKLLAAYRDWDKDVSGKI
jgi:arylsulfatase A-like enzyme